MKHIFLLFLVFIFIIDARVYKPSFKASMKRIKVSTMQNFSSTYNSDYAWQQLDYLYTKHYRKKKIKKNDKFIIPPIIHQIWLGPKQLPVEHEQFRKSWEKFHPDWQYKLWHDIDIEEFGLINKAAYQAATNFGEKSDIARIEILERFGGIYADDDFECLRSFEDIVKCCEFFVGLESSEDIVLFNGLIGSIPHHPILKAYRESYGKNNIQKERYNSFEAILFRSGPFYFTDIILGLLPYLNDRPIIFFPSTFFYPWPNEYRASHHPEQIKKWIRPESYAIHHWAVSWFEEKFDK